MEFLAAQLRQIRGRLNGSSPSQWVAIAMFVVLLGVAFVWMMNWAGQGEWSPLLDQTLSADESQRVLAELALAGVEARVEGDRIKVRGGADARQRLQALLAERGAMPRDISLSYREIVKQSNPFRGDREAQWIEGRGLETELSGVISRFHGVKEAHVNITTGKARGFTGQGLASASVSIVMRNGETLNKGQVDAIAKYVSGAVQGLKPTNVNITDGLKFYRPSDDSEALPAELIALQKEHEDHAARKIYDQLRHIRGAVVNVHAELRTAEESKSNRELGPPTPMKETSKTEETTSGSTAAAPGVRPNEGRSLTDGGTGSTSSKEDTTVEYAAQRNTKETTVKEMVGTVDKLTASISVPFSYLENVYRKQQGLKADAAVKAADIDPIATIQIAKIRALVKPLICAKGDEDVAVDWYFDSESSEVAAAAAATQAADAGAMSMWREWGPKAGLGLLALASLFTVARLARKSTTIMGLPPVDTGLKSAKGARGAKGGKSGIGRVRRGHGGDDEEEELEAFDVPLAVGEAHEMAGVLEGREVDESVVRTQQIVKQIAELVKDDPRAAASLVERWARKD